MADFIVPSIKAFLACDYVLKDSATGKVSIVGVFTDVNTPAVPCFHQQIGLYVCFTDASGKYDFAIDLIYLNENQRIGGTEVEASGITDRLQIYDFGVMLQGIWFPGAGRYEFRLSANHQLLAQKDFRVVIRDPNQGV